MSDQALSPTAKAPPPSPPPRPPGSGSLIGRVWRAYAFRRFRRAVLVVFIVTNAGFFLMRAMPGDPVDVLAGQISQRGVSPVEARALAIQSLAFDPDAPIWKQWWEYFSGLATGDMGTSVTQVGVPVSDVILKVLPWTLFSVGAGVTIAITLGLLLGMLMAYRRNSRVDHALSLIASVMGAIPNYLIAIALVTLGSTVFGVIDFLKMRGRYSQGVEIGFNLEFIGDALYHGILPIATYTLATVGTWMLVMKAATTEVLGDDYVTVARARGLTDKRIALTYVGRNAVLPLVPQVAIALATVIGGAILVEQVLAYEGLGLLTLESVNNRDYFVLQGVLVIGTSVVVFTNWIADLVYGRLDPRVRVSDVEVTS
ncbi:ABC transporter permease [Phytomonospora endophytica]|uniref:Peptide/nickel transport system permease protein n=1 Tax=Phytomonospora endophytica TaxID=714109 RepID=A0A841FSS9_9ACTN|nr:ABC transporter permease [Phytomonospora endophytica]MBB6036808.1 peptide/nickel transport system permease protein [Phytomonospora endophytica]GIG68158.1 peptide ABC transporter permease [Phytomonospora endophytica]